MLVIQAKGDSDPKKRIRVREKERQLPNPKGTPKAKVKNDKREKVHVPWSQIWTWCWCKQVPAWASFGMCELTLDQYQEWQRNPFGMTGYFTKLELDRSSQKRFDLEFRACSAGTQSYQDEAVTISACNRISYSCSKLLIKQ